MLESPYASLREMAVEQLFEALSVGDNELDGENSTSSSTDRERALVLLHTTDWSVIEASAKTKRELSHLLLSLPFKDA